MENRNPIYAWFGLGIIIVVASVLFSDWGRSVFRRYKFNNYKTDCLEEKRVKSCDQLLISMAYWDFNVAHEEFILALDVLCKSGDLDVCVTAAKEILKKKEPDPRVAELLMFSCKNGYGGNMEACGILGEILIKEGDKIKGREYLDMACKVGEERFCQTNI